MISQVPLYTHLKQVFTVSATIDLEIYFDYIDLSGFKPQRLSERKMQTVYAHLRIKLDEERLGLPTFHRNRGNEKAKGPLLLTIETRDHPMLEELRVDIHAREKLVEMKSEKDSYYYDEIDNELQQFHDEVMQKGIEFEENKRRNRRVDAIVKEVLDAGDNNLKHNLNSYSSEDDLLGSLQSSFLTSAASLSRLDNPMRDAFDEQHKMFVKGDYISLNKVSLIDPKQKRINDIRVQVGKMIKETKKQ